MLIRRYISVSLILVLLSLPLSVGAQTPATNADIHARIRKEGMERSQIMKMMHMLTDIYGPRLTGSPNHKRAAEWTIKQMREWGMQNGRLEPWDFGHPGWLNERLTAHIIAPVKEPLACEVLAWTPSTRGQVRAPAYQMIPPERPTQEQLGASLAQERSKIRGRIVLVGKHQVLPVNLSPAPKRTDDAIIERRFDPEASPSPRPRPSPSPGLLTPQQIAEQIDKFLKDNGALSA